MRAQIAVPAGSSPVARTSPRAQAPSTQARPRGVSFATEEVSRIPAPTQVSQLSLPLQTRVRTESAMSFDEQARLRTWTMESQTAMQEVPYSQRRKSSFAVPVTPDSRWCPGYSSAISFPGVTEAAAPLQVMAAPPGSVMLAAPPGQMAAAPGPMSTATSVRSSTTSTSSLPAGQPAGAFTAPGGQQFMQMPYMQMPPGYMQMPPGGGFMQMPGGGFMMMPPGYQGFPVAQAPMPAQQPVRQQQQQRTMAAESGGGPEPITTIMLRNIPLKYTRETLLSDMDHRGFALTYDFFYLPMDFERKCSVGYAFINFISPEIVVRFKSMYQGLQLATDSAKVCEVGNAKVQGKQKNIQYYRNSSVMGMDEEYQPVIFENGVRAPFPRPTQTPKPFRPRAGGGAGGKP